MSFEVASDRRLIPVSPARRYVRVAFRVPDFGASRERPRLCLGLVLAHSASMAGRPLTLTQQAAKHALHALSSGDQFSVVAYNERVSVLAPSVAVSTEAIDRAEAALDNLRASGASDLGAGWLTGCAQIAQCGDDDRAIVRCLLLGDGLADAGIARVDRLVHHATELRARGVTTSTIGVGDEFNEQLLHRIADAGGGHFSYAENTEAIGSLVDAEVKRALDTVALARLWVRCDQDVKVVSLNGAPARREGGSMCIELDSLRSGQWHSSLLALDFPAGAEGSLARASFGLSDLDETLPSSRIELRWTRATAAACVREKTDQGIRRDSAILEVAGARVRALDERVWGNPEAAERGIVEQLHRLRSIAGDDPVLLTIVRELASECEQYERPQLSPTRKRIYYDAYGSLRRGLVPPPDRGARKKEIFLRWLQPALAYDVERARKALYPYATAAGLSLKAIPTPSEHPRGPRLEVADEFRIVRELAQPPDLTVVFTSIGHHDNWFSHWYETGRLALVSLHDWERMSSVPAAALIAYEGLLHGLRALSPDYDPLRLMHADQRGCLFDFCQQKPEVEVKLQVGHICPECTANLSSLGLDSALIARAWSAVQQLAHVESIPIQL